LSFGRFAWLGRWLKQLLVRVLIYRKRLLRIRFSRIIDLQEDTVTIEDTLAGPDGVRVAELHWQSQFTTIHMGSSRYFINNEIHNLCAATDESVVISPSSIVAGVTLRRSVDLKTNPPQFPLSKGGSRVIEPRPM
jgi:hypothetical protein